MNSAPELFDDSFPRRHVQIGITVAQLKEALRTKTNQDFKEIGERHNLILALIGDLLEAGYSRKNLAKIIIKAIKNQ